MRLYRKTATIISIFSILIAVNSFSCSTSEEKESVQSNTTQESLDDYKDETPTFVAEVKTEIKENYLFFSYKGPEFAFVNGQMNDTAHRLSNYAARITGDQLKKLFKEGKYSKVDLSRIVMKTKGMDNKDSVHYTLKIPLIRVKSACAAFTSFDHSGGWNHAPDLKKRLEDLKKPGRTTVHCNSLRVSKRYITKENLQEYWIQWKNRQLQGNCPCK